ncbi:MAG: hypothetical protein ACRBK7_30800 [Acidimicrobiales bacterium]
MTSETDRVSVALQDIASWYAETGDTIQQTIDPSTIKTGPASDTGTTRHWGRLALVAVSVLAAIGLAGLVAKGAGQPTLTEPGTLANGLERLTIMELCLDVATPFELGDLRSSGTVHSFGPTGESEMGVVVATSSLHVACGLAKRDDNWFQAVSVVATHQPLSAAQDVSVHIVVELGDKVYVAGQAGPEVQAVTIERNGKHFPSEIDSGWWGGYFDNGDLRIEAIVPNFTVRWSNETGSERTASGVDLLQERAWLLCAQSDDCSENRITELYELALSNKATAQSNVLADRLVTVDEYRSTLREWGTCIGENTGNEVTYDADGLFAVQDANAETAVAFEECKQLHAALIIEAVGLRGVVSSD